MQAKNTALSSELVKCTVALLNRSEWVGAGNAVTPQLKSGCRSKEGKKSPHLPTKEKLHRPKINRRKKKRNPMLNFWSFSEIFPQRIKWYNTQKMEMGCLWRLIHFYPPKSLLKSRHPKSTLQILLPKKIEWKTFKTSQNTSVISETLTSTPPLPGTFFITCNSVFKDCKQIRRRTWRTSEFSQAHKVFLFPCIARSFHQKWVTRWIEEQEAI